MRLLPIAAMLMLAGCSHEPAGDSYFPLHVGASWTYDVSNDIDGTVNHHLEVVSVPRTTEHGADQQVYVRRAEVPGAIGIEYWLRKDNVGISRIAIRTDVEDRAHLDPNPRTVLKLPLTVGSSWMVPSQPFAIGPKTELGQGDMKMPKVMITNTVEEIEEEVTVPAGTFKHCARIVGTGSLPLYLDAVQGFKTIPIVNREWYCKGIGLVKLERTELLQSNFFTNGTIKMELSEFDLD